MNKDILHSAFAYMAIFLSVIATVILISGINTLPEHATAGTEGAMTQELRGATLKQHKTMDSLDNTAQNSGIGRSCCHGSGRCSLGSARSIGSKCYCPSSQGPVEGVVC